MEHALKLSRYLVVSPTFEPHGPGAPRRILYSTLSGDWYLVDARTVSLLEQEEFDRLPRWLVDRLRASRVLVDGETDEIAALLHENAAADAASSDYMLTLMPSASCQMACQYCAQSHQSMPMSQAVQDQTIQFVESQFLARTYTDLYVTWFGAEPLTGLAAIRALTPRLQAIARARGARYGAYLITNGLMLTPSLVQELHRSLGVRRIQVTLDGSRSAHDLRRPRKGGQGTYSRIMENLGAYFAAPIESLELQIRANVDCTNSDSVEALISDLLSVGAAEARARVYVHNVFEWGNGGGSDALSDEEFAEVELRTMRHLAASGMRVDLFPGRARNACPTYYRDDSPLVDTRGVLHSCYEDPLARDSDPVPYGRAGSVFLGSNQRKRENGKRLRELLAVVRDDPKDCLNCSMLPVCGGTCEPWRKDGRKQCPGYKHNMEERLLLAYATLPQRTAN